MKIGILGCGYDCIDDLQNRLSPWFEAAKESKIIFSFVSCMFKEYKDININTDNSKTIQYFQKLKDDGLIQFLTLARRL